ncbi:MAG TPA: DUF1570 domain-containing protein [Povalibacter sp.]
MSERSGARFAFALILLLAAVLPVARSHAADWIRAQTDHFVVYSNVGASTTKEYLEQLEGFKYLAELLLGSGSGSAAASTRFTLYLFDDQEVLKTVRPEFNQYIGGVYLHCVEGAQAYVWRPSASFSGQDPGLTILLHEYSHHVMFSRMRRFYPAWYVEGFAEYLSTVTLRNGTFAVGRANEERLAQLTNDRSGWIDSAVMLDPKQLAAAQEAKRVNLFQFYAQSWLLTHFMLSDSKRAQGFNEYFERVGRGEDALSGFSNATGIAPADLERLLRSHLRKMPGVKVSVPQLPDTAITIVPLQKEQDDYLLEASVIRTCPGETHGKKLLESLRAKRPQHQGDITFRTELSRAELLFGDADVARRDLEILAATDGATFDVFYLLGRSYENAAQRNAEERDNFTNKASAEFLTAYKMDKLNAPNLYFLSRTLDDGGTPNKGVLNASMGAAVLAPSVHAYAINAAVVSLRADNPDAAIRVMQPFASDPHNPTSAARVTAMITAIRDKKELAEVMSTLSGESPEE